MGRLCGWLPSVCGFAMKAHVTSYQCRKAHAGSIIRRCIPLFIDVSQAVQISDDRESVDGGSERYRGPINILEKWSLEKLQAQDSIIPCPPAHSKTQAQFICHCNNIALLSSTLSEPSDLSSHVLHHFHPDAPFHPWRHSSRRLWSLLHRSEVAYSDGEAREERCAEWKRGRSAWG